MKRGHILWTMMAIAVLLGWAGQARGAWSDWHPLSVPEMAAHGATHVAIFDYTDFSAATTTNAAVTFTNSITAKSSVECVGMLLDVAFDTGNTNFTGSCAMKIGDGSDDDLFLTSTELASDGTEVFVKYAPVNTYTVVAVNQTNTFLTDTNGTSAAITNVRSVTAAATAGELSRKLYAAAGNIVYTFTPNLNESLSVNTKGQVRIYFKLQEFLQ